MNPTLKVVLLILGILAALLIVSQVVLALLILNGGAASLRTAHQHSGYLMATVSLLYVALSLIAVGSAPTRPKA